MTEHDALYTSMAATNAYARRTAREISKHNRTVIDTLLAAIHPVAQEMVSKGKLARDRLVPSFNSVVEDLNRKGTANIVQAEIGHKRSSKLSANDELHARLVLVTSDPEPVEGEQWFDFLALEFRITRREITMRLDPLDMAITPHVLARFMQRDRQGVMKFFANVMRPLRVASVLGVPAFHHKSEAIALPTDNGLLLGQVDYIPEPVKDEDRAYPFVVRVDKSGAKTSVGEFVRLQKTFRAVCRMRTYVDENSASPLKSELRQAIVAWERQNERGITTFFELMAYGQAMVKLHAEQQPMLMGAKAAMDSSVSLVRTPIWSRFATTRSEQH